MPDQNLTAPELKYLESYVIKQVERFEHKAKKNKRWTYLLKISGFAIAGTITVLAGLNGVSDAHTLMQSNAILCLGALSTFLASLAAFWNVERYWLENLVIADKVRLHRDKIRYAIQRHHPMTEEEMDRFWSELQQILGQRTRYWAAILEDASSS